MNVYLTLYAYSQVCKYVILSYLVNYSVWMNVFYYICGGIDLFVRFFGLGIPSKHKNTRIVHYG